MESSVPTLKDISWNSICNWIAQIFEEMVNKAFKQILGPEVEDKTKRNVFKKISVNSLKTEMNIFETAIMSPAFERVEHVISSLPCSLANEATEKLTICVIKKLISIRTSFVLDCRLSVNLFRKKMWLLKYIGIKMVNTVFHPQTTILEFQTYSYPEPFFKYIWTQELTMKMKKITVIRNLTVFEMTNLDYGELSKFVAQLKLKEFTFSFCTDELLTAVARGSAESLRILNVSESDKITNYSVTTILQFKNLVSLNINNTYLTSSAVSYILNHALCREVEPHDNLQINSFSGVVCSSDLNAIQKFKNLTHLELRLREHVRVTQLNCLKNLTSLDIGSLNYLDYGYFNVRLCNSNLNLNEQGGLFAYAVPEITFEEIAPALMCIGRQLQALTLREISNINLKSIEGWCPRLQHFGIYLGTDQNLNYNNLDLSMPSVESLVLRSLKSEDYIALVASLTGLKKLELVQDFGMHSDLAVNIVQQKILQGGLRELIVGKNSLKFDGHWKNDGIRIPEAFLSDVVYEMLVPIYMREENNILINQFIPVPSRWRLFLERIRIYPVMSSVRSGWRSFKRMFRFRRSLEF